MNLDQRSIPYRIVERFYQILILLVLSVVFTAGGNGQGFDPTSALALFVLFLVPVVAWEVAYVRRYDYHITADTFDIHSGVFSRREREIPFERIQNVDIAQNVVQRAIGIAEVRLETAGGGISEARLRYVSEQEAARLQELISDRKRGEISERESGEPTGELLFELDRQELAVLGVTSANFQLFGLVIVLLTIGGTQVEPEFIDPRMWLLLVVGPLLAIAGLVVVWIISGIQAVLQYYGFRLTRHEGELRYERGLLQRYNGTIPLSKVQTLMISENVFARTVGYASLVIETAGYSPEQGSEGVESAVPIAKRDRVLMLADTIEGIGDLEFERPPKRARRRYVGRYTIIVAVITGIAGAIHATTGSLDDWYLAAVLLVLVLPAAHLKWKNIGYYYDDRHVVTQFGFWTRKTTIVPYYRVQTISDSQNVFQARRDLGTLVVDTATSGGFWGGDATAPDIDVDVARDLRELVHERFHEAIQRRSERLASDSLEEQATSTDGTDDRGPDQSFEGTPQ